MKRVGRWTVNMALLLCACSYYSRAQEVTGYRVLSITFNTNSPVQLSLNRGRLIWRDTDLNSGHYYLKYYSGAAVKTLDSNLFAVAAAIDGDHIVWNTPVELIKAFDTRTWQTVAIGASYNPDFIQPVSVAGDLVAFARRKAGSGSSIIVHRLSTGTDTAFSAALWNVAPSVHHGQVAWVGADSEVATSPSNIFFFNGQTTRNLSGTSGRNNRSPLLRDGQVAWLESSVSGTRVRLFTGDSVTTPATASSPIVITGFDLSDGIGVAALKDTVTGRGSLRLFNAETGLMSVIADSNGPSHPRLSNGLLVWQSGVSPDRRVELYMIGAGPAGEYTGGENPVVDADLVAWTNGDAVELARPTTTLQLTNDGLNGWEQTKFKTIDSAHVLWGNFSNSVNMRLFYGEGGTAVELADSATTNDLVMANDGYVIWRRNFDSLFYYDGSHPPVKFLDTVQAENPYVAGGSVGFFGIRVTVNETIKHAWLYEIAGGKLTMLSSDSGVTGNVLCDGKTACWLNGHTQRLMFYDGSVTTQLSDSVTDYNYSYRNGMVVWIEHRNGFPQVFSYDVKSQSKTQVSTGTTLKEYPITDGSHIVWYDTFVASPDNPNKGRPGGAHLASYPGTVMVYYDVGDGRLSRVAESGYSPLFWNWMSDGKIAWLQEDGTINAYDGNVVSAMMPNDGFRGYSNVYLDRDMLLWKRGVLPLAKDNGDIFRQKLRPHVAFVADHVTGDAPFAVAFTNRSWEGGWRYLWEFGDGVSSTQRDPVHTYLTPGSYTVSLTVTGVTGSVSEKKFRLIRALPSTGVTERTPATPLRTELLRNYPNPFNPTTVIEYTISIRSDTKLVVYDVLGREVATLVSDVNAPGSYRVKWDASGFASGMYFYTLSVGSFRETHKMMLVK